MTVGWFWALDIERRNTRINEVDGGQTLSWLIAQLAGLSGRHRRRGSRQAERSEESTV